MRAIRQCRHLSEARWAHCNWLQRLAACCCMDPGRFSQGKKKKAGSLRKLPALHVVPSTGIESSLENRMDTGFLIFLFEKYRQKYRHFSKCPDQPRAMLLILRISASGRHSAPW